MPAGTAREGDGTRPPVIRVVNKIDQTGERPRLTLPVEGQREDGAEVRLCALTGEGLDLLQEALRAVARGFGTSGDGALPASDEGVFIARRRHIVALEEAAGALDRALALARAELGSPELVAEELRLAHRALGTITGEVTSEDLLGEIFSRFCIGK